VRSCLCQVQGTTRKRKPDAPKQEADCIFNEISCEILSRFFDISLSPSSKAKEKNQNKKPEMKSQPTAEIRFRHDLGRWQVVRSTFATAGFVNLFLFFSPSLLV
jgi:hypothetical protein